MAPNQESDRTDAKISRFERKVIENEDTTYRIVSKSVTEYHFIVPYILAEDERVEVGQIFSIRDRGLTFLARVLNIEHASNYDGHWDTTMKGTQFFDQDQIFNRVIAEPLGCIPEKGGFKKSRTLPTKFAPVSRAETGEFRFLRDVMGDIEVGFLRNGSRLVEAIPVALHSEAMDHHMGVFATTGMGKSNFMKVFAASCMRLAALGKSKFGLLIVDPHGEYLKGKGEVKGLKHLKRYQEGLACYSTDRKNAQDPGVEELAISKSEIRPEDIALLYDWSPPQRDALEAISRIFDSGDWLEEILTNEGLVKMVQEGFRDSTVKVLALRIENVLAINEYVMKRSSIPNILANLGKGKVVLVDIPRMSDRSELFLLSVISRHILDEYKKDDVPGRKNCLITIEEAQRVLGAGSNTSRFESIAREGRKFGVGLCAITQQPKLLDRQLLSQFNTLVVMGLGDRNDRLQLEESAKQDLSSLDIEIQTLEKGEAVVSTLDIPFPVPARIHRFEEYLRRLEKEENEESLIARGGFKPFLE
ncbi:DNA double-strand break repair helicase HerA [uncultured archaeon]|nr:DNA double-strand break repair helicase HerA [uncultured archaeon]